MRECQHGGRPPSSGAEVNGDRHVFLKILGIVALAWIALVIIGVLSKGLFPILVISAVVFGFYLLYKSLFGSNRDMTPAA